MLSAPAPVCIVLVTFGPAPRLSLRQLLHQFELGADMIGKSGKAIVICETCRLDETLHLDSLRTPHGIFGSIAEFHMERFVR